MFMIFFQINFTHYIIWWLSQQTISPESSHEEVNEPWFKAWISCETELTRPDRSEEGQLKKERKEAILLKRHHPCCMCNHASRARQH